MYMYTWEAIILAQEDSDIDAPFHQFRVYGVAQQQQFKDLVIPYPFDHELLIDLLDCAFRGAEIETRLTRFQLLSEFFYFAHSLNPLLQELRFEELQCYQQLMLFNELIEVILLVLLLEEGKVIRYHLLHGINFCILDLLIG